MKAFSKIVHKLMAVVVSISLLNVGIFSAEQEMPTIGTVEISGNKFVNTSLIKNQLRTQKGKVFSRIDVNNDIKRLYQLNYFSKIDVEVQDEPGNFKVIFKVVEKPIVDRIIFTGNSKVKTKTLRKEITSKENEIINENLLANDVVKLKQYYEKKGYKQINVSYESKLSEDKKLADITFKIDEGRKIKIERINIIGARQIKEKKVLKVMKVKRKRWYNSGVYEEAKFLEDLDRIRAFYYEKGYVDIKILGVKESYNPINSRVTINIEIDEGHLYNVGDIDVEGNKVYSKEELEKDLKMMKGTLFLPANLQADSKSIQDHYFKNGYIDAKINAATVVSPSDPNVLNIKYTVVENKVVFIDKILVTGNEKTKDIVVRRELNLKPGDKFDGVQMETAQRRLSNLAIFKNVDIYPDPSNNKEIRDLMIEVEEDKTGELSFGAGYSSVDRLLGFVEVSQSNFDILNWPTFTGDAQKLKFRSEFGQLKQDFSIDFTEPWLFEKRLMFGVQLFTSKQEYTDSDYTEARKGFTLRLAKPVFKNTRGEIRYSFENVDVQHVPSTASEYLKSQAGSRDVGLIGLNLTRDVRDNFFNATQGSRISLDTEIAGVGGNTDYYRGIFSSDLYYNPWFNNVFVVSFRTGAIKEYGSSDDVPIFERFFLGGPWSIRGFDYRDIGPHDNQGEPMGGKFMYYGTFEYVVPLVEQFRLATFYDYGNLYPNYNDVDLGIINTSFGVGARIMIQKKIPLRFDYSWPLHTDEYHKGEGGKFTFDIGNRF